VLNVWQRKGYLSVIGQFRSQPSTGFFVSPSKFRELFWPAIARCARGTHVVYVSCILLTSKLCVHRVHIGCKSVKMILNYTIEIKFFSYVSAFYPVPAKGFEPLTP
jgi:hypothetical protein